MLGIRPGLALSGAVVHAALGLGCDPADAPAGAVEALGQVVFSGACDASGAVPIDERLFVVADDEDNVLRLYDAEVGGPPLLETDVSRDAQLLKDRKRRKGRPDRPPKSLEADLEAGTRVGELALWISSHGRNQSGKSKQERLRLFATTLPEAGRAPEIVGEPYVRLLDDLLGEPRLAGLGLAAASQLPPHEPGALNIEGMTARSEGGVLLGFRNPIPRGRALLLPLLNPEAMLRGDRAALGGPILLDLGGRGVRSLTWWRGRYLIAAGPSGGEGRSHLYEWDGHGRPRPLTSIALPHFQPEAFFTPESRDEIMVLSDDGSREVEGEPCKRLDDPERKTFRGLWLRVDAATARRSLRTGSAAELRHRASTDAAPRLGS